MPGWVREGINGSAELAEVPSPTLEPLNPEPLEPCFWLFSYKIRQE